MTEDEWVSSTDPAAMVAHLRMENDAHDLYRGSKHGLSRPVSDRKLRLFAWWCYKSFSCYPGSGREDEVIREKDSTPSHAHSSPYNDARYWANEMNRPEQPKRANFLRHIIGNPFRPWNAVVCYGCNGKKTERYADAAGDMDDRDCTTCDGRGWLPPYRHCEQCNGTGNDHDGREYKRGKCPRCVGRGYTILLAPVWTADVRRLAEVVYEGEDTGPMLVDALVEIGLKDDECKHCEGGKIRIGFGGKHGFGPPINCPVCSGTGHVENTIVRHFREEMTHMRGCHFIDVITGRE